MSIIYSEPKKKRYWKIEYIEKDGRFFLFLFLLAGWLVQARASDDFGFWGSVSAEKKLYKGLGASFEGEFRSRDNVRTVERWSVSAGLSYKLTNWLKISSGLYISYIIIILWR